MKRYTLTSAALFLFLLNGFSQDLAYVARPIYHQPPTPHFSKQLFFELLPAYSRPVKREALRNAKLISDVVNGYPVNWISNYVSVEILATCQGKLIKAESTNNVLSAKQRQILTGADMASNITINVKYRYKNPVTANIEKGNMHVLMTVAPENDAQYGEGYQQMKKYLKEHAIDKILETLPDQYKGMQVKFTVNEEGEVSNARISASSGDPKTDQLLLDAVRKMPRWKPAVDEKGAKVKQEFKFNIENGGDGC